MSVFFRTFVGYNHLNICTMKDQILDTRLTAHFRLNEFLNLGKYPENRPEMQQVVNMTVGCTSPGTPSATLATTSV
jgi:hypothetical protein